MTIGPGIDIPAEQIREIWRRYRIRELSLFGSAARGEMGPDSDIDILVEFDPDTLIGWEFFDLEEELAALFDRKVDLGTKASLKSRIRQNVLREARVIYSA